MFGVTLGYYNTEYRPFKLADDSFGRLSNILSMVVLSNFWYFNTTLIKLRKIYFFAQLTFCRAIFHLQKSKGYQINGNCLSFPQNIKN